jgi:hypothetical protein
MEDTGGFEQPANCKHLRSKYECDQHDDWGGELHDDQRPRLGDVFAASPRQEQDG